MTDNNQNNTESERIQCKSDQEGTVSPLNGAVIPASKRIQKGETRNPGGMPKGTSQPTKWLDALADKPEPELQRIARDKHASVSKRAAARILVDSMQDADSQETASRHRATKFIHETIHGKPHQTQDVAHSGAVGGALLRVDVSEDAMRRIEAGNKRSGDGGDEPTTPTESEASDE